MRTPWPWQFRADSEIREGYAAGDRASCITSPTGGGKSHIIEQAIRWGLENRWRSVLYTNRRMLLAQLSKGLEAAGVSHGKRASGHETRLLDDVQVSSLMTEHARRGKWDLHDAQLVFIDEAHNQKGQVAERIIGEHLAAGAMVLGFTATPLGIGHIYNKLIVAGVNSELRAHGAHVICHTYAPDEPDTRKLKPKTKTGEFTEGEVRKAIMTPTIFARVYESWKVLNPDARPAILFGPGVGESLWFAEQFYSKGVSAAHIDGDDVWINGRQYPSDDESREAVREGSKDGSIKVVCNRFVLREGIDMPWLYHGIFATIFGALASYLQAGGRIPRAHESLDHVILQDHGGNWWRHGSLNMDREWSLEYDNRIASGLREQAIRQRKEREPIVCPECHAVRSTGPTCRACGHTASKRSRMVVQQDGRLKEMTGDIFRPQVERMYGDTEAKWMKCYHQARNSRNEMTFAQARGWFFHQHHYYPPRNLPHMPLEDISWYRAVKDVPKPMLIQKEGAHHGQR